MNLKRLLLSAAIFSLLAACGSDTDEATFDGVFVAENVPGSYTVSFVDGDAEYVFDANADQQQNNTVIFPCDNCDEEFTWSVDEEGRLLLRLTGGDSNTGYERDRYTLLSGSESSGQIQLDRDLNDDGIFEEINSERASFIKIVD